MPFAGATVGVAPEAGPGCEPLNCLRGWLPVAQGVRPGRVAVLALSFEDDPGRLCRHVESSQPEPGGSLRHILVRLVLPARRPLPGCEIPVKLLGAFLNPVEHALSFGE
jgi:hypothetical protein